MGSYHYPCGCSVSNSMFPEQGILDVNLCYEHLKCEGVQEALITLAKFAGGKNPHEKGKAKSSVCDSSG